MGIALAIEEDAMDNNILCVTQMMGTDNGKCLSVQMLDDAVGLEFMALGIEASTADNIAFVDDSRTEGGMIVCRNGKKANSVVARDVEKAEAKRDSIRAFSSG